MLFRSAIYYCLLASLFVAQGCDTQVAPKAPISEESNPSFLVISKDNNGHIGDWMRLLDSTLLIRELYGVPIDSLDHYLGKADAIIIGGGEDVNPVWYNKPEYAELCGEFDNYRDSMEIRMIRFADENKIPIMGICRGQQIINVAHGGTLIPDIPTFVNDYVTHSTRKDSAHIILPVENAWISASFDTDTFWVNSRHHQSIDRLAPGFEVVAYARDSVVEAIYIKDTSLHPFTMAVQFHPENLRDSLSNTFGRMLLRAIE